MATQHTVSNQYMLVINRVVFRSLRRNEVREIGGGGGAGNVLFRVRRLNKFWEDITSSISKKLVCLSLLL